MCMSIAVRFARLICYSMIMWSVEFDPVKEDTIHDEDVQMHVEVDMLNGVRRFAGETLEICSTCALQSFRKKERRVRVRILKARLKTFLVSSPPHLLPRQYQVYALSSSSTYPGKMGLCSGLCSSSAICRAPAPRPEAPASASEGSGNPNTSASEGGS